MSEVISTRLPRELVELMEREAEGRGVSLSRLLKDVVEEHYKIEGGRPEEPFLRKLEKALVAQGTAKMKACSIQSCPFKAYKIEPEPIVCGICLIHSHALPFSPLPSSTFNPLQE